MGLFRRPRRNSDDPILDQPDDHLLPLTIGDARDLTELARSAFAAEGLEVVPDGRGALIGDQRTFGLANLAALVAQHPRRRWPNLARRHARGVLAVHEGDEDPLDIEAIRPNILLKLRPGDDLEQVATYAPEILPGILLLVAIDHPDHVRELFSDETIEELGGWEELRDIALGNLRRLGPPDHETIQADPAEPDSTVHLFGSDDFFGAARLAILPEVLAHVGIERPSHGTLIAVPNRHLLLVHPLEGPGLVSAVQLMVRLASSEYHGHTGPLSPQVFYRSADGEVQQVTMRDEDTQTVEVHVAGPFAQAFDALGLTQSDDD